MSCPVCGSKNVQKISTVGKYAKIGVFGILGADDLGKRAVEAAIKMCDRLNEI